MLEPRQKRKVAVLIDAIEDDYQAGLVRGVVRASVHGDAELVVLAGGVLDTVREDERSQRNFLFDLVEPKRFQGIVAFAGALGTRIGMESFATWSERFGETPQVNLGVESPGHHSIGVNGGTGMHEVVTHLIKVHGHRRLAFVRGPVTSREAEERYAAYRQALADNDIELDERLVVVGDWLRESGALAVSELFDSRVKRSEGVTAIVCANDYMALGALDAVRERGLAVPSDVAITGFDDIESIRGVVPPLTTVRQPLEALGRDGMLRLTSLMSGKTEPLSTSLGAQMVQRRSCGCTKLDLAPGSRREKASGRSFESTLMERRALLCAELARSAHGTLFGAGTGWEERLVAALVRDLTQRETSSFVSALERVLVNLQRAGGDLSACQAVLSVLRKGIQECAAGDYEVLGRANDIFDASRELIGESLIRSEILRKAHLSHQLRESFRLAATLAGASDLAVLRRDLEERARALGIATMSVGLFTEPGQVTKECVCLVGYSGSGRVDAQTTFDASEFAPREIFEGAKTTLLVQPLVFDGKPIGIVTTSFGSFDVMFYEQLREILGTGLHARRMALALRAQR